jgi:hypothetical protein
VVSRRDLVADHVWKKLEAEDGSAVFLEVMRSCESEDVPPAKGFVRMHSFVGWRFESTADGTKTTLVLKFDPRGSVPPGVVNFALKQQMKLRIESYKTYFIDRKAPDGSDNGGDWADDERIYSFKVEGGDGGGVDMPRTMTAKELVANMNTSQEAGPAKPKFIATLRRVLGWFFFLFGAAALVYVNTTASRQGEMCEEEFGACVWERIEPKLCVRERASDCARGKRSRESEAAARERSGCARAKRLRDTGSEAAA